MMDGMNLTYYHNSHNLTVLLPSFTAIDGGVSDFGPWGKCSKTCGGGRRSRERACNRPLPNDPGQGCEDLTEVEDCNVQPCPS